MRKILTASAMLMSATIAVHADTLYDAVQFSMITNPEVLYNTAKGLTNKQEIDKAKGAYYPSADITAGAGRQATDNPTTRALVNGQIQRLNRTEKNFMLKESLFAGGAIAYDLKRTQFQYEGQKWKTQGVAEDTALKATDSYLKVLLHQQLYRYALTNLHEHRSVYKLIQERNLAGLARTAEVYQATARLALAESNKISAEANLREAKINYAKVVGKWPMNLVHPKPPTTQQLPHTLQKAIERGMDNHPTVKSTYAYIKQAKSSYEVARAAYYPKVDLVLSAMRDNNLDGLPGSNNDQMVMVRMSYNVFKGGSDVANVKETAYQVQEAYEIKNKSIIDLKESVRLSWNAWVASQHKLSPLREHVNASYKTRSAYVEEFKIGKRTLLDLLDSQNEYYQSQIEYANAQKDEVFSRYRLLSGMGCLLPYMRIKVPDNVVNTDLFTSAQRHVLLDEKMDEIPYPNDTDDPIYLSKPVSSMEQAEVSEAQLNKNAGYPIQVRPKLWYVVAGYYHTKEEAEAFKNRLDNLGFITFTCLYKGYQTVFLGPYEYRGHAANGMERLKEVAHVEGLLVTFKGPLKKT